MHLADMQNFDALPATSQWSSLDKFPGVSPIVISSLDKFPGVSPIVIGEVGLQELSVLSSQEVS